MLTSQQELGGGGAGCQVMGRTGLAGMWQNINGGGGNGVTEEGSQVGRCTGSVLVGVRPWGLGWAITAGGGGGAWGRGMGTAYNQIISVGYSHWYVRNGHKWKLAVTGVG